MLDPIRTAEWLKSSHILVPDDWLQACVEWIQSENQASLSQDELNSMVYEQWLLADLHELETRCLPTDVATGTKYQLKGAFALQIDSIMNVGQSFYSQSQTLKGTENANVLVTAEDPKPWEQKPSRMLLFKMTDGSTSVTGMEYKPISCLNPSTRPGAKILVHGEILCRHGYLMLENHHLTFLGGEVDTLVEANTPLNTLKSAMDASLQHAGKNHQKKLTGSKIINNKAPGTSPPPTGSRSAQQTWSRGPANRMSAGQQRGRGSQQQVKTEMDEFMDDDPFLDEMDMDDLDLLSQPNTGNQNSSNVTGNQPNIAANRNQPKMAGNRNLPNMRTNQNQLNNEKVNGNNSNFAARKKQSSASSNSSISKLSSSSVGSGNTERTVSGEMPVRQASSARINEVLDDTDDFADGFDAMDDIDDEMLTNLDENMLNGNNRKNSVQSKSNTTVNQRQRTGIHVATDEKPKSNGTNSEIKVFPLFNQKLSKRVPASGNSDAESNTTSVSNGIRYGQRNASSTSDSPSGSDAVKSVSAYDEGDMAAEPDMKNVKKQEPSLIHASSRIFTGSLGDSTSSGYEAGNCVKVEKSDFKVMDRSTVTAGSDNNNYMTPRKIKKIKEEQHTAVRSQLDIQSEYPFTYLSRIMSQPQPAKPTYHTVKAYISTLTSKLSNENQQWKLSCKINDGTMAVDVDLSSQVLTELIGFSPQEAMKMRARIKTDPSVKQVLAEGLQQCQQKLIELMCLLELELSPMNTRPLIVATREVTPHHIEMLYNRVMANWHKFDTS